MNAFVPPLRHTYSVHSVIQVHGTVCRCTCLCRKSRILRFISVDMILQLTADGNGNIYLGSVAGLVVFKDSGNSAALYKSTPFGKLHSCTPMHGINTVLLLNHE